MLVVEVITKLNSFVLKLDIILQNDIKTTIKLKVKTQVSYHFAFNKTEVRLFLVLWSLKHRVILYVYILSCLAAPFSFIFIYSSSRRVIE